MKRYLLDTSALLTLRDDENGADTVADLMYKAQDGKCQCFGCFLSLMEILYRVWKDEDEFAGRLAYEQCRSLPVTWVHETKELLELAAKIKAENRLSVVDAWIAASALSEDATLVHKDPEFISVPCPQIELPYKRPGRTP